MSDSRKKTAISFYEIGSVRNQVIVLRCRHKVKFPLKILIRFPTLIWWL